MTTAATLSVGKLNSFEIVGVQNMLSALGSENDVLRLMSQQSLTEISKKDVNTARFIIRQISIKLRQLEETQLLLVLNALAQLLSHTSPSLSPGEAQVLVEGLLHLVGNSKHVIGKSCTDSLILLLEDFEMLVLDETLNAARVHGSQQISLLHCLSQLVVSVCESNKVEDSQEFIKGSLNLVLAILCNRSVAKGLNDAAISALGTIGIALSHATAPEGCVFISEEKLHNGIDALCSFYDRAGIDGFLHLYSRSNNIQASICKALGALCSMHGSAPGRCLDMHLSRLLALFRNQLEGQVSLSIAKTRELDVVFQGLHGLLNGVDADNKEHNIMLTNLSEWLIDTLCDFEKNLALSQYQNYNTNLRKAESELLRCLEVSIKYDAKVIFNLLLSHCSRNYTTLKVFSYLIDACAYESKLDDDYEFKKVNSKLVKSILMWSVVEGSEAFTHELSVQVVATLAVQGFLANVEVEERRRLIIYLIRLSASLPTNIASTTSSPWKMSWFGKGDDKDKEVGTSMAGNITIKRLSSLGERALRHMSKHEQGKVALYPILLETLADNSYFRIFPFLCQCLLEVLSNYHSDNDVESESESCIIELSESVSILPPLLLNLYEQCGRSRSDSARSVLLKVWQNEWFINGHELKDKLRTQISWNGSDKSDFGHDDSSYIDELLLRISPSYSTEIVKAFVDMLRLRRSDEAKACGIDIANFYLLGCSVSTLSSEAEIKAITRTMIDAAHKLCLESVSSDLDEILLHSQRCKGIARIIGKGGIENEEYRYDSRQRVDFVLEVVTNFFQEDQRSKDQISHITKCSIASMCLGHMGTVMSKEIERSQAVSLVNARILPLLLKINESFEGNHIPRITLSHSFRLVASAFTSSARFDVTRRDKIMNYLIHYSQDPSNMNNTESEKVCFESPFHAVETLRGLCALLQLMRFREESLNCDISEKVIRRLIAVVSKVWYEASEQIHINKLIEALLYFGQEKIRSSLAEKFSLLFCDASACTRLRACQTMLYILKSPIVEKFNDGGAEFEIMILGDLIPRTFDSNRDVSQLANEGVDFILGVGISDINEQPVKLRPETDNVYQKSNILTKKLRTAASKLTSAQAVQVILRLCQNVCNIIKIETQSEKTHVPVIQAILEILRCNLSELGSSEIRDIVIEIITVVNCLSKSRSAADGEDHNHEKKKAKVFQDSLIVKHVFSNPLLTLDITANSTTETGESICIACIITLISCKDNFDVVICTLIDTTVVPMSPNMENVFLSIASCSAAGISSGLGQVILPKYPVCIKLMELLYHIICDGKNKNAHEGDEVCDNDTDRFIIDQLVESRREKCVYILQTLLREKPPTVKSYATKYFPKLFATLLLVIGVSHSYRGMDEHIEISNGNNQEIEREACNEITGRLSITLILRTLECLFTCIGGEGILFQSLNDNLIDTWSVKDTLKNRENYAIGLAKLIRQICQSLPRFASGIVHFFHQFTSSSTEVDHRIVVCACSTSLIGWCSLTLAATKDDREAQSMEKLYLEVFECCFDLWKSETIGNELVRRFIIDCLGDITRDDWATVLSEKYKDVLDMIIDLHTGTDETDADDVLLHISLSTLTRGGVISVLDDNPDILRVVALRLHSKFYSILLKGPGNGKVSLKVAVFEVMARFVDVVKLSDDSAPLTNKAEIMGVERLLPLLLVYVKSDPPIAQKACGLLAKYLNVLQPGLTSATQSGSADIDDSVILSILLQLSRTFGGYVDICLQTCIDICSETESNNFVCSRCIYLMPLFLKAMESVDAERMSTDLRQTVHQIILDASSEKETDSLRKTQALYALYLLFNESG